MRRIARMCSGDAAFLICINVEWRRVRLADPQRRGGRHQRSRIAQLRPERCDTSEYAQREKAPRTVRGHTRNPVMPATSGSLLRRILIVVALAGLSAGFA